MCYAKCKCINIVPVVWLFPELLVTSVLWFSKRRLTILPTNRIALILLQVWQTAQVFLRKSDCRHARSLLVNTSGSLHSRQGIVRDQTSSRVLNLHLHDQQSQLATQQNLSQWISWSEVYYRLYSVQTMFACIHAWLELWLQRRNDQTDTVNQDGVWDSCWAGLV